jgi:purine-cytosine permease-like protein
MNLLICCPHAIVMNVETIAVLGFLSCNSSHGAIAAISFPNHPFVFWIRKIIQYLE